MTVDVPRGRQIMEVASYGLKDKLLAPYEEIKRRLGGRVNVHVINPPGAWYWCLEAISPSAGKGSALLALAGLLRIPGDETAAVGDDVNDLDMVSKAGLGIAMGNASEEIRRAADVVVGPNTQDGLAQALRYILAYPAKLEPAAPHK
jgi:hydroxymethylpyrimidine pyrophosphatase-like HAD family hydrolase